MPIFWVGMMGLLVFYAWLGWVGGAGRHHTIQPELYPPGAAYPAKPGIEHQQPHHPDPKDRHELATMAIIVGAGLGIPLGVLAAARRNSVSDYVVRKA
jgi:ABC-type dipeptide/oligopeptide/nickel transport system permease component